MDIGTLRENGKKPVRITAKGEVFIGDDAFPYPISDNSIKVERRHKRNYLTVTLIVGDVSMESRKPTATCKGCGIDIYGAIVTNRCAQCGAALDS